MILRKLQLRNFLVFYGEQNVTLILANNNSGKTSIIRALKFLFYGAGALNMQRMHGRPSALITERATAQRCSHV